VLARDGEAVGESTVELSIVVFDLLKREYYSTGGTSIIASGGGKNYGCKLLDAVEIRS
jgi:hypothetical protein